MKPIKLQIEGLNSFDEEQVIDFECLTVDGIFGIFGPTGSGKSTIVDAITMALYGEISRLEEAKSQKQCINTNRDKLSLSFEFQLMDGSESKVYCISRTYKKKEERLNCTRAVLVSVTDDNFVIADKNTDCNREIRSLIGLSFSDFTRAVVLPQGKFSQFLLLANQERRDMLERIFHLEQYGTDLKKRINEAQRRYKEKLTLIEAQLSHYGNISREIIEENRQTLGLLQEEISGLRVKISEQSELVSKLKALKELQDELTEWRKKKEKLESIGKVNEEKRKSLALAEKAAPIIPKTKELERVRALLNENRLKLGRQELILEKAKLEEATCQEAYTKALIEKNENYPILTKKEISLKLALGIKKDLDGMRVELEQLLATFKTLDKKLKGLEAERSKLLDARTETTNQVASQKQALLENAVSPEVRILLNQACQTSRELEGLSKSRALLAQKTESLLVALDKAKSKVQKGEKEAELLRMALEEDKARLSTLRAEATLSAVAHLLEENKACPLCGSFEHPKPYGRSSSGLTEERKENHESHIGEGNQEIHESQKALEEEIEKKTALYNKTNIALARLSEGIAKDEESLRQLSFEQEGLQKEFEALTLRLKGYTDATGLTDFEAARKQNEEKEKKSELIKKSIEENESLLNALNQKLEKIADEILIREKERESVTVSGKEKREALNRRQAELSDLVDYDPEPSMLAALQNELNRLNRLESEFKQKMEAAAKEKQTAAEGMAGLSKEGEAFRSLSEKTLEEVSALLEKNGFLSTEEAMNCFLSEEDKHKLQRHLEDYDRSYVTVQANLKRVEEKIDGFEGFKEEGLKAEDLKRVDRCDTSLSDIPLLLNKTNEELLILQNSLEENVQKSALLTGSIEKMLVDLKTTEELFSDKTKTITYCDMIKEIAPLFEGNRFVEYMARGQLRYITAEASRRLKEMSGSRYALELDGTDFVIRDDFNGGVRRSPRTLSGGETFMTSLCLALALSSKIQLKNKAPLEFFFLDEGFGTLDSTTLEVVMNALERLRLERITVGIISHVEELKARINRKLVLTGAETGFGTRVSLDLN